MSSGSDCAYRGVNSDRSRYVLLFFHFILPLKPAVDFSEISTSPRFRNLILDFNALFSAPTTPTLVVTDLTV